jgi:acyl-coenzyme A thioesterase PaaI-like protein
MTRLDDAPDLGDGTTPAGDVTGPGPRRGNGTAPGRPAGHADREPVVLSDTGSFINDLCFELEAIDQGARGVGRATITPGMRSPLSSGPGLVRPAVLLTIADCIAGVPAMYACSPRLAVTLDMVVRIVTDRVGPELAMTSELLKQGRSTVASEVRFTDAGSGELVALCYLTFMASARPQDLSPPLLDGMAFDGSMPEPFPERVGIRAVAPGVTELDRRPFVVQASDSLQGGMVALLGETAAESLTGRPVTELDIRFFTGVRVGPGRATARSVGDGVVRVEVRDAGSDDRLAALVVARVATVATAGSEGSGQA